MYQKYLRIATWNANDIQNRKQQIELFFKTLDIDICLETLFTNHTCLKINGHQVSQSSHPENKANGGSDIIIKNRIKHHKECHLQAAELTLVGIKSTKQKLNIGVIYCPLRHNLKEVDYKKFILHLSERFIVGGHYNATHVDPD